MMDPADPDVTQTDELPTGYVEKTEGTIGPNDLVWSSTEDTFRPADASGVSAVGEDPDAFQRVATPAYWVTFDGTTGVVWGVGETAEESLRTAKFEAFGDDHGAVGYEFACWCEEMSTKVCSETLYARAKEEGCLSLSDDRLRKHVGMSSSL